jgi:hypothetical protein
VLLVPPVPPATVTEPVPPGQIEMFEMVAVICDVAFVQGAVAFAVKVNVTVPVYKTFVGVHVAFNVALFGLKVPETLADHVTELWLVALPAKVMVEPISKLGWLGPALAVGAFAIVAITAVRAEEIQPVVVFLACA